MCPSAPPRFTIRHSFALVWRTLRSMRTALVLLFLLAAGAAVGSLLPQIPNSPQRVASYELAHPFLGALFLRAGFFDVFGSWWFVLILTLLFVSLIACLIPRSRAMIGGKATGYVGHATLVEGQTWTDAAFNYDGDLRTGRFSSGSHTGIGIRLIDYSDAFRQSGVPMDFTSKVELLEPDGTLARSDTVTI